MYMGDKLMKEQKFKKNPQNPQISPTIPSFSSSLLDEIYRSIDQGDEKSLNPKSLRNRVFEKQSNLNGSAVRENTRRRIKEDEIETLRRASLIESWIEKNKLNRKSKQFESFDLNPLFFSSSLSSSGSNSSFETDFSGRENPMKIKISTRSDNKNYEQGEFSYLENYHNFRNGKNDQGSLKNDDNLIKSKSRALKIYSNLKKIKQPISPGGRLTSFLNSLFNNGVTKKAKNPRASISTEDSSCSSASSYTRSCLSRNSSKTNRKSSNGEKRTVSFCPVDVVIDEDNRACGHRHVHKGDYKEEKISVKGEYLKGFGKFDEDEYDDMASDSSSDLFELDHLAFAGNNGRNCEELPVYETTRFHTNIAIANGLIR